MISPMPTMMRNVKKGMITGGRSSGGKASSPTSRASQVARGDETAKLRHFKREEIAFLRDGSGMAINTSLAGCCVFQRASIAANLAG